MKTSTAAINMTSNSCGHNYNNKIDAIWDGYYYCTKYWKIGKGLRKPIIVDFAKWIFSEILTARPYHKISIAPKLG